MLQIYEISHTEMKHRHTLHLRTIIRYDRDARRPITPVIVGKHTVARRPLANSVHTLYLIFDGAEIAGAQISYPSEADCADAIKRLHNAKNAAEAAATKAIVNAKKPRQRRALTIREAA
ncbi:beta-hexosaminidase [Trinickia terrae]|uniref:Beta-hexosaminidase n=1 Tax=Trinickia terrae TaxID=2571161 RepID=A0A4U1HXQ8_9BURK|nr:beta-hexosaminidase [Trinickia terrae]TKC83856.1 beta-hexosaminidase [Trinickia terrae]